MTIKQIYNLAIELGINADPRGKRGVERWLLNQKKKYQKLNRDDREFFDRENMTNPYADSRLHFGDPSLQVKTILTGIDTEEAEIALISALSTKCEGQRTKNLEPDLIITHHPIGKAYAALDEVMAMQADMMAAYGVPINIAEGVMTKRIEQVGHSLSPINHMRTVDAAKLANLPIMNIHTPADNLVSQFLQKLMDRKKPETVGETVELLRKIPEYKIATLNNAGPQIFAGSPENRTGKIIVNMTGGTSGGKEIYPELAKAGVGTIIDMHMKEESREEASKNHLNVIIAGHISSDSLGMNLFLDKLAARNIKIIPCGGLTRVRRK
ncbi:MAG: NGG1p interacting factor NIF3 [Patescibacteria group bacterium]|nr:NGG1p interacting factor NIF3 [Patescibacteria group bacterium]